MRFLSVCSGIEAASVAWEPMGMRAVAFAEVEAFPSAVLAHRFPHVPNLGDMTKIDGKAFRGVDIVVGGTPCQAFSVAGLRRGLEDARGNLTLRYVELVDDADPDYAVWENVPGVLSSKDNAFGCFIAGLAGGDEPAEPGPRPAAGKSGKFWRWDKELGAHVPKWPAAGYVVGPRRVVAWRCLDAQFSGLAQRRLRVFVVACPRNGADPREILFEREGVRWNPPPRREAGEGVAGAIDAGSGGADENDAKDGRFVLHRRSGGVTEFLPQSSRVYMPDGVSPALQAVHQRGGNHAPHVLAFSGNAEGSSGLPFLTCSNIAKTVNNQTPLIVQDLMSFALRGISEYAPGLPVLRAKGGDCQGGSEALVAQCAVPVACGANAAGQVAVSVTGDIAHTLNTANNGKGCSEDGTGRGVPTISIGHVVRRLTPTECERLQGFPDGWTDIPYRGKPAADGPRYKAIGNSMATQVMRWIGLRIVASYWRQKTARHSAISAAS